MIYRHFKGGLYFLKGYATPFSDTFYDKSKTTIEVMTKAIYEPTMEEVDVVIVYDKNVKSTYYSYDSDNLSGVMCFYRGLNGQYWLRPREDFYKEIAISKDGIPLWVPRFEKVNGENLFDIISDLFEVEK